MDPNRDEPASAAVAPPTIAGEGDRAARRTNLVAVALAAVAAAFFALAPIYTLERHLYTVDGDAAVPYDVQRTRSTIAEVNGPGVYAVLALPVVLAAAPLAPWSEERRRRWRRGLGWTLLAFCALTVVSIGLLYLPAAAALLFAGRRAHGA